MDIGAVEGLFHDITGTEAITGLGTVSAGIHKVLKFEGIATLTHNATSLILPGSVNITTAVGDIAWFISEGSGNWRCLNYQRFIDAPHSGFTTGDAKLTFKTTADPGWVLANDGSIGSASSGATNRANADTQALYTLLWTNVSDTYAPVATGRGASAAADFGANKAMTLPKSLGRVLGVYGSGSGLTARSLGETTGAETVVLSEANLAAHTHVQRYDSSLDASGANTVFIPSAVTTDENGVAHTSTATTTGSTGSGTAHANMQPTSFWNVMIRL